MEIYKLNLSGTMAHHIVDGVETGLWCNTETNESYLAWLEEGNEPLPADGASVAEPVAEPAAEPLPPDEVPE